VGLSLGGDGAEPIALAIVAQIQNELSLASSETRHLAQPRADQGLLPWN
jgi:xanthine/CO dehydrogenase XdhC/CoxF family maturation factor